MHRLPHMFFVFVILLGFGLVLSLWHHGGENNVLDGRIATINQQIHTHSDHGNGSAVQKDGHDHGDLHHCQEMAGHCAAGAPALLVQIDAVQAIATMPLNLHGHDDLRFGLSLLPAVPPPEVA